MGIIIAGAVIGIFAVILQVLGNPPNMGICVACMERDIAGALNFHGAGVVKYLRPEIIGFLLGAYLIARAKKEYQPRAGSAPMIRFFLGIFAMIGALIFLGCPWRAILRLAGGDLNTLIGIPGLIIGIWVGVHFLKNGFTLGRTNPKQKSFGWILPALFGLLLILFILEVIWPNTIPVEFSAKGPGAMHTENLIQGKEIVKSEETNYYLFIALAISLSAGLLFGILGQRTRFCTVGSFRDVILVRDFHLISGVIAFLVGAAIMNVIFHFALDSYSVNPGYYSQPISHSNALFNFFGMALSGISYTLAGGCPGRQLVLAGEGDTDSGIFVLGMITGAGISHMWGLAAIPDKMDPATNELITGGPGTPQMAVIALAIGFVFCFILGFTKKIKEV